MLAIRRRKLHALASELRASDAQAIADATDADATDDSDTTDTTGVASTDEAEPETDAEADATDAAPIGAAANASVPASALSLGANLARSLKQSQIILRTCPLPTDSKSSYDHIRTHLLSAYVHQLVSGTKLVTTARMRENALWLQHDAEYFACFTAAWIGFDQPWMAYRSHMGDLDDNLTPVLLAGVLTDDVEAACSVGLAWQDPVRALPHPVFKLRQPIVTSVKAYANVSEADEIASDSTNGDMAVDMAIHHLLDDQYGFAFCWLHHPEWLPKFLTYQWDHMANRQHNHEPTYAITNIDQYALIFRCVQRVFSGDMTVNLCMDIAANVIRELTDGIQLHELWNALQFGHGNNIWHLVSTMMIGQYNINVAGTVTVIRAMLLRCDRLQDQLKNPDVYGLNPYQRLVRSILPFRDDHGDFDHEEISRYDFIDRSKDERWVDFVTRVLFVFGQAMLGIGDFAPDDELQLNEQDYVMHRSTNYFYKMLHDMPSYGSIRYHNICCPWTSAPGLVFNDIHDSSYPFEVANRTVSAQDYAVGLNVTTDRVRDIQGTYIEVLEQRTLGARTAHVYAELNIQNTVAMQRAMDIAHAYCTIGDRAHTLPHDRIQLDELKNEILAILSVIDHCETPSSRQDDTRSDPRQQSWLTRLTTRDNRSTHITNVQTIPLSRTPTKDGIIDHLERLLSHVTAAGRGFASHQQYLVSLQAEHDRRFTTWYNQQQAAIRDSARSTCEEEAATTRAAAKATTTLNTAVDNSTANVAQDPSDQHMQTFRVNLRRLYADHVDDAPHFEQRLLSLTEAQTCNFANIACMARKGEVVQYHFAGETWTAIVRRAFHKDDSPGHKIGMAITLITPRSFLTSAQLKEAPDGYSDWTVNCFELAQSCDYFARVTQRDGFHLRAPDAVKSGSGLVHVNYVYKLDGHDFRSNGAALNFTPEVHLVRDSKRRRIGQPVRHIDRQHQNQPQHRLNHDKHSPCRTGEKSGTSADRTSTEVSHQHASEQQWITARSQADVVGWLDSKGVPRPPHASPLWLLTAKTLRRILKNYLLGYLPGAKSQCCCHDSTGKIAQVASRIAAVLATNPDELGLHSKIDLVHQYHALITISLPIEAMELRQYVANQCCTPKDFTKVCATYGIQWNTIHDPVKRRQLSDELYTTHIFTLICPPTVNRRARIFSNIKVEFKAARKRLNAVHMLRHAQHGHRTNMQDGWAIAQESKQRERELYEHLAHTRAAKVASCVSEVKAKVNRQSMRFRHYDCRHERRTLHAKRVHHQRSPTSSKKTNSDRRRYKTNAVPSHMYGCSKPKAVNTEQQYNDRKRRSRKCRQDKSIDTARRCFKSSHSNSGHLQSQVHDLQRKLRQLQRQLKRATRTRNNIEHRDYEHAAPSTNTSNTADDHRHPNNTYSDADPDSLSTAFAAMFMGEEPPGFVTMTEDDEHVDTTNVQELAAFLTSCHLPAERVRLYVPKMVSRAVSFHSMVYMLQQMQSLHADADLTVRWPMQLGFIKEVDRNAITVGVSEFIVSDTTHAPRTTPAGSARRDINIFNPISIPQRAARSMNRVMADTYTPPSIHREASPERLSVTNLTQQFAAMSPEAPSTPATPSTASSVLSPDPRDVPVNIFLDNDSPSYTVWVRPDGSINTRCGSCYDSFAAYAFSLKPRLISLFPEQWGGLNVADSGGVSEPKAVMATIAAPKEESKEDESIDFDNHVTRRVGHNHLLDPYTQPEDIINYVSTPAFRSAESHRYVHPKPGDFPQHAPDFKHADKYKQQLGSKQEQQSLKNLTPLQLSVTTEFRQATIEKYEQLDGLLAADGGRLGRISKPQKVQTRRLPAQLRLPAPAAVQIKDRARLQESALVTESDSQEKSFKTPSAYQSMASAAVVTPGGFADIAAAAMADMSTPGTPPGSPAVCFPVPTHPVLHLHSYRFTDNDITVSPNYDDICEYFEHKVIMIPTHLRNQHQAMLANILRETQSAVRKDRIVFQCLNSEHHDLTSAKNNDDDQEEDTRFLSLPAGMYALPTPPGHGNTMHVALGGAYRLNHHYLPLLGNTVHMDSHLDGDAISFLGWNHPLLVQFLMIGLYKGQPVLQTRRDVPAKAMKAIFKLLRFHSPIRHDENTTTNDSRWSGRLPSQHSYRYLFQIANRTVDERWFRSPASMIWRIDHDSSDDQDMSPVCYISQNGRLMPLHQHLPKHRIITYGAQLRSTRTSKPAIAVPSDGTSTPDKQSQRCVPSTVSDTQHTCAAFSVVGGSASGPKDYSEHYTPLDLHHRRFGHLAHDQILEDQHLYFPNQPRCYKAHVCTGCALAKRTARSRPGHEHRQKDALGFFSIDTMVLRVTPSAQGNVYLYNCVDHATRLVFAFSTATNDASATIDVLHSLKMACAELGFSIVHVKSDRGELVSQQVLSYIADQGYSWELTSADDSNRNAVVENKHFRMRLMVATQIADAHLKQPFHEYAVQQSCRIMNSITSSVLKEKAKLDDAVCPIPMLELRRLIKRDGGTLWNYHPIYQHLRVWGCICYAYIYHKSKRQGKFMSVAKVGLNMGNAWPGTADGYHFLDLATGAVSVCRNMFFDEHNLTLKLNPRDRKLLQKVFKTPIPINDIHPEDVKDSGLLTVRVKNKSGNYSNRKLSILNALRLHIAVAADAGESIVGSSVDTLDVSDPFVLPEASVQDVADMADPAQTAKKKHALATKIPLFAESDVLVKDTQRFKCIKSDCIRNRVRRAHNKTVAQIRKLKVKNAKGDKVLYSNADIKWDLTHTYLRVKNTSQHAAISKAMLAMGVSQHLPLHLRQIAAEDELKNDGYHHASDAAGSACIAVALKAAAVMASSCKQKQGNSSKQLDSHHPRANHRFPKTMHFKDGHAPPYRENGSAPPAGLHPPRRERGPRHPYQSEDEPQHEGMRDVHATECGGRQSGVEQAGTAAKHSNDNTAEDVPSSTSSKRKYGERPSCRGLPPLGRCPKSVSHIASFPQPYRAMWQFSLAEEQLAQVKSESFDYVPVTSTRGAMSRKPQRMVSVMKEKLLPNTLSGESVLERCKWRMCLNGSTLKVHEDFADLDSPTMNGATHRLLHAFARILGFASAQFDLPHCFLQTPLADSLMSWPADELFKYNDLNGVPYIHSYRYSVYGGKQSGHLWWREVSIFLVDKLGFISLVNLPAVFIKQVGTKIIWVGIFVDDGECFYNDTDLFAWFQTRMIDRFGAKFMGRVGHYLGGEVQYDDIADTTTIKLKSYMEQIATPWGLDKMKHPRIPLEEEITASQQPQNDKDKHFMKNKPYAELLGILGWFRTQVGPQYGYAFNRLASVTSNPALQHFRLLKRCLAHVYRSRSLGWTCHGMHSNHKMDIPELEHLGPDDLFILFDSNFGTQDCTYPQVSAQAYLGFACIMDVSTQIKLTATSTCEAEMAAGMEACKLAVYLRKVFDELRLPVKGPVPCFGDNSSMLIIAEKSHPSRKCRHWRIRVDWIQQLVDLQIVKFHKIASINNISDVTTKVVPSFTWEGLSRLMVGASPKFIPGTQINVRYAQQLARDERACDKDTDLENDSYAAKLTHLADDKSFTRGKALRGHLLGEQRGSDAGHFSRSVAQRSYAITNAIGGCPVHQAKSAGAA